MQVEAGKDGGVPTPALRGLIVRDAAGAEWIKLRSVRSTLWILAVVAASVLLCMLWSWYVASHWDGLTPEQRATVRTPPAEQPLLPALPVCAAVLGALSITSEYATGTIRTSLAAVPGRGTLFAAKVSVSGVMALTTSLVALTVAVAAEQLIVGDRPIPAFEGTMLDRLPCLVALSSLAGVIALVGCGLGAVLRSTARTITILVGVLMVLPTFGGVVPGSRLGEVVVSVSPLSLPFQIAAPPGDTVDLGILSPLAATAVLAAYAATALALGAFSFVRRDS
ncbi:ABC transporter permease subunit [Actinomadura sp. NBRC 104412]|uniref:ABC transporter permease subunit n=1 Tax=Actinomadura sp. NBRC 104412 TaxID=3032203 RepID=UPI0025575B9D|nr:ABC transporter permease subunit [Actinomadura sp. NBRC 104412]